MTTSSDGSAIETLIAKDAIRDLVLLYCRGCDRKDFDLLRTLYTEDATDSHDESYDGPASGYVDFLARSLPHVLYSGHHICNHLIAVDVAAGTAEGEAYAIAQHIIPDRAGGWIEDFMCCRYIDRYRRCEDGRWRFSRRVIVYDSRTARPYTPHRDAIEPAADPSYHILSAAPFRRGLRP